MTEPLHLWLAGDLDRAEWAGPTAWLRTARKSRAFAGVAEVAAALAAGEEPPELLVIAQARPGEIAGDQIEALRRQAPLLPIVQLAGSWCEGELRTGRPWRASERLYAHQVASRLADGLARHAAGMLPGWGLPLTVTEDERFLERLAPVPSAHLKSQISNLKFAIQTSNHSLGDWLVSACRARGAEAVSFAPHQQTDLAGVTAGIWDGHALSAVEEGNVPGVWDGLGHSAVAERDLLAKFVKQLAPRPVVALLSFPRIDDLEHARKVGAAAIVSKPFLADDLFAAIAP